MAKIFTVAKAFRSKNKDTGEFDVVKTENGDFDKYMFQVEGQGKPGWMQMLKKPGNTLEAGDELYGIIDEWDNGNAKWQKVQKPVDIELKQAPRDGASTPVAPATNSAQPGIEGKLDYIISLLENRPQSGTDEPAAKTGSTDDTTAPINLDELDY